VVGIRIGFVSRREMESVKLVESLINKFKSRAEISVEPELGERLGMKGAPVEEMDVDLVVSVGGDGTILRTIHKMRDPVPILGINMGTLGFLVDVEPRDAVKTLEHILFGFEVDERSRLEVALNGNALLPATNEVALLTASPAKMIDFEIIVTVRP
jgi:NAD+ kinase